MDPLETVQCLVVTLVTVGFVANPVTVIGIWRSKKEQKEVWKPLLLSIYIAKMISWIILCPISLYLASTSATQPPAWLVRMHAQYNIRSYWETHVGSISGSFTDNCYPVSFKILQICNN